MTNTIQVQNQICPLLDNLDRFGQGRQFKPLDQSERRAVLHEMIPAVAQKELTIETKIDFTAIQNKIQSPLPSDKRRSNFLIRLFKGILNLFHLRISSRELGRHVDNLRKTNLLERWRSIPVPQNSTDWAAGPQLVYRESFTPQKEEFKPLSTEDIRKLLDGVQLQDFGNAEDYRMTCDAIVSIYEKGCLSLSKTKDGVPANKELRESIRFILYKIQQEPDQEKKKLLLLELAAYVKDCIPDIEGTISRLHRSLAFLHRKLASRGDFEKQLECFLSTCKEKIVDEAIYELYPAMKDPIYAAAHSDRRHLRFLHIRNGLIAKYGTELRLMTEGAITDPHRNPIENEKEGREFCGKFRQKMVFIPYFFIKDFLADINGRKGQIDIKCFQEWCTPSNLGMYADQVMYDQKFTYPKGLPAYPDDGMPYLTEDMAYRIFVQLEYIQRNAPE